MAYVYRRYRKDTNACDVFTQQNNRQKRYQRRYR